MASEIQLALLPQQFPSFPLPTDPARSAFEFTYRYLPTGTVGGDFFTVSALSEIEAAVFICDVAGHGVRAALVTAIIRALVEELKPVAGDPGEFLTKLNRELHAILKHTGTPTLTTAFYLVADWRAGAIRYANAGHPKPLQLRRNARQVVPLVNASTKSQPPLGFLENTLFASSRVEFAPTDLVMLFTDGLVEVQAPEGELYSQALLITALQQRLETPTARLFDELLAEILHFSGKTGFADDVCIVGIEAGL